MNPTKDYYKVLTIQKDAKKEEIKAAWRRLVIKYHPDKNRGNEEWARKKFIEVGEAYAVLSGKQKSGSSNKFSSDAEFEKFEEMLKEVRRQFNETERGFNEYEENRRQEEEKARSEAIRSIEENLTSSNVSISELDSSLWSPYSD